MRRPLLMTFAAGAVLTVAACGKKGADMDSPPTTNVAPVPPTAPEKPDVAVETSNPPSPGVGDPVEVPPAPPKSPIGTKLDAADPPIYGNPPPPQPITVQHRQALKRIATGNADSPAFADVKSPHPEGATNPPSPVLLVTPKGDCYKTWEGGMIPAGPDRVQDVEVNDWTTKVKCPVDRAEPLYTTWIQAGEPVYVPK
ncbi:MAG: hypothetical protein AB8H79_14480 [Myxococcota bacterium]